MGIETGEVKPSHTAITAAFERLNFDLVLMDVHMPEMDGLEATAAIRETERSTGTHIPIFAMTAHVMKGDREQFLAAGMDGYITKPVQAQELFEVLKAFSPAAKHAHPPPPKPLSQWEGGEREAVGRVAAGLKASSLERPTTHRSST